MTKLFWVAAFTLLVSGCATTSSQLAVAEDAVHDHLAKMDDEYKKVCNVEPNATTFKPACDDTRPLVIAVLTAGRNFSQCVLTPNAQKLTCLPPIVEAGSKLVEGAKKLPAGQTVLFVRALVDAVTSAALQVKQGGQ